MQTQSTPKDDTAGGREDLREVGHQVDRFDPAITAKAPVAVTFAEVERIAVELRKIAPDAHGPAFVRSCAVIDDAINLLRQQAAQLRAWRDVFGHLGEKPDEIGNLWLAQTDVRDGYRETLQEIAEQDPVELVLDPQWAKRVARACLAK